MQARRVLAARRQDYSQTRSHSALGNIALATLAATFQLAQEAV